MTTGKNQNARRGADSHLKGLEIKEKFEFYLLALVFTVLALAVQTSKFQERWYIDVFEIIGWVFLLISGITGLLRLERVPIAYFLSADIKNEEQEIEQLGQFPANTEFWTEKLSEKYNKNTQQLKNVSKDIKSLYGLHKWLFVAGIVSIALARVLPSYDGIRDSWRQSMTESDYAQHPPSALPSRPAAAITPPAAPTKPAEVSAIPPAKISPPTKQRK
jgi:hypothetical protein